jgi:hypothetical protein
LHAIVQLLRTQAGCPFGSPGQALHIDPQAVGVLVMSAHAPFGHIWVAPAGHIATHAYVSIAPAPELDCAAQWGAPASHAWPQAPQFAAAV